MTHTTQSILTPVAAIVLSLVAVAFLAAPALASAASYAYVDATGEVKSVTASDWMTAIAIAPNIHVNSGVFELKSASDFAIIGEDIR